MNQQRGSHAETLSFTKLDMETDVAGCSKGNWQRLGLEPYFHHFPFFSFRALSTNTWKHLEICRTAATQKFL